MTRFDGKVAFVTGAASGIGLATAARSAREGGKIYAADINAELLAREIGRLGGEGLELHSRVLDVRAEEWGRVQIPEGADMALYGRMFPLTGYYAQPEEIAGAVAYLASDEAKFVTGSALVIDGGQTAV